MIVNTPKVARYNMKLMCGVSKQREHRYCYNTTTQWDMAQPAMGYRLGFDIKTVTTLESVLKEPMNVIRTHPHYSTTNSV